MDSVAQVPRQTKNGADTSRFLASSRTDISRSSRVVSYALAEGLHAVIICKLTSSRKWFKVQTAPKRVQCVSRRCEETWTLTARRGMPTLSSCATNPIFLQKRRFHHAAKRKGATPSFPTSPSSGWTPLGRGSDGRFGLRRFRAKLTPTPFGTHRAFTHALPPSFGLRSVPFTVPPCFFPLPLK